MISAERNRGDKQWRCVHLQLPSDKAAGNIVNILWDTKYIQAVYP